MSNFVLTYHGGSGMAETPEEQEKQMAAWGAWFGQLGEAVVDMGNPLGARNSVHADGSVNEGGPAADMGGYSVISAADMNAALEAAKGCPVLAGGGSVQVSEALVM